jgi:ubiquinone/menaquinone biosynthesis C-methylase UbiE
MMMPATSRYLYWHWPLYVGLIGGGTAASLLLLAVGQLTASVGWLLWSGACLLGVAYFAAASLWLAYQRFDAPRYSVMDALFALGQLDPEDQLVHVELGERRDALALVRHLTTGHLTVVDIYTPYLVQASAVLRQRALAPPPIRDPRLTWHTGEFTLFPVPDHSIHAVTMQEVLPYIESDADRMLLLQEIQRVLKPGGHFLLAMPVRSNLYRLAWGPLAWQLETAAYWSALLEQAGLRVTRAEDWRGVLTLFRADKLTGDIGRQLQLFGG